jgi:hypothetical protein
MENLIIIVPLLDNKDEKYVFGVNLQIGDMYYLDSRTANRLGRREFCMLYMSYDVEDIDISQQDNEEALVEDLEEILMDHRCKNRPIVICTQVEDVERIKLYLEASQIESTLLMSSEIISLPLPDLTIVLPRNLYIVPDELFDTESDEPCLTKTVGFGAMFMTQMEMYLNGLTQIKEDIEKPKEPLPLKEKSQEEPNIKFSDN